MTQIPEILAYKHINLENLFQKLNTSTLFPIPTENKAHNTHVIIDTRVNWTQYCIQLSYY